VCQARRLDDIWVQFEILEFVVPEKLLRNATTDLRDLKRMRQPVVENVSLI
jgi:hypothetical protein